MPWTAFRGDSGSRGDYDGQGNCMWPRFSLGSARVAGILPAIRGRDALDTSEQRPHAIALIMMAQEWSVA